MPFGTHQLGHAVTGTQTNLTVAGTAGALTVPAGAQAALIQNVGTSAIVISEDGTTATASPVNTFVRQPGEAFIAFEPSRVSMIRLTATSGVVSVGYYLLAG
jgi:hypothetical protein